MSDEAGLFRAEVIDGTLLSNGVDLGLALGRRRVAGARAGVVIWVSDEGEHAHALGENGGGL